MSESEPSSWAAPANETPKTPDEMLQERYVDRNNPDNMDDMVVLPSEKATGMIEVPDWVKERPEAGDPGYETGFDDDPFALGKEVNVKRYGKNGQPNYNEGGWTIVNPDTNVGRNKYTSGVIVEKVIDGETFQKSIHLDELTKLNPREAGATIEVANEAQLTEAQKDIADEAIEDVLGTENFEDEVDGNARMMTLEERQQARAGQGLETEAAAAARVMGEPAHSGEADGIPSPESERAAYVRQIDALNAALNVLVETLSKTDRAAVWQNATAINYTEQGHAQSKLSDNFEKNNPGLLTQYADTFKKIHGLRVKAGIFDK
jgi:hypothetical protein